MNNETLKRDLCARIPNNPLMQWTREEDKEVIQQELNLSDAKFLINKRAKLILHPISALTKPIQMANYNNGEPFVPAIELLKKCSMTGFVEDFIKRVEIGQRQIESFATGEILEYLIKWHINYRLSPEQFIEVTDEFNPYL